MKALSVKQPVGKLISDKTKPIETRVWEPKNKWRGDILIVASKARFDGFLIINDKLLQPYEQYYLYRETIKTLGMAICVASLVDVRPMVKEDETLACCPIYPGAKSWILDNIRPVKPFPVHITMNEKIYFLCSEEVVKAFPGVEKSKPFESGYDFDKGDKMYVAVLNFKTVEKHYKKLEQDAEGTGDFWCQELVPGQMEVSKITIAGAKRKGLFREIEEKIGLTATRNQAMTIYNLSQKYNCTPIEFINKIV